MSVPPEWQDMLRFQEHLGDVWVYAITVMYIPTASIIYSGPVGNSTGGKSWQ